MTPMRISRKPSLNHYPFLAGSGRKKERREEGRAKVKL